MAIVIDKNMEKLAMLLAKKDFDVTDCWNEEAATYISVNGNVKNLHWECEYLQKMLTKAGITKDIRMIATYNPKNELSCDITIYDITDHDFPVEEEEEE